MIKDLLDLSSREKIERIILACETLIRLELGDKTPNQISEQLAKSLQASRN